MEMKTMAGENKKKTEKTTGKATGKTVTKTVSKVAGGAGKTANKVIGKTASKPTVKAPAKAVKMPIKAAGKAAGKTAGKPASKTAVKAPAKKPAPASTAKTVKPQRAIPAPILSAAEWQAFTEKMEQSLLAQKAEIIENLIVSNNDFKEIVEGMDPKDFADIASDDIDRKMIEALGSQE
jgi:hypothetical protein